MKAFILAGGKGSRLLPYTTNFPKPLMPIKDKPILEIVIDRLRKADITDIIFGTGHMAELLQTFFGNGEKFGVKISYSREDEPLGTAGPLNLVRDKLTDTFLVMNGDILTDIRFHELVKYHENEKSTATVALSRRTVDIDFGVVTLDSENQFLEWKEKPQIEYMVSTGIYIFEPEALDVLPGEGFFNLPDLIVKLAENNKKVKGYIHHGYWLDIGRPGDYAKACEDYGNSV
ncbi:MAG: NTP transferase domain-containing protein [Deltaproteobacteria bacterium]|jgi:NDP-sugar pyrophosphorylase family protein|nr:NTP transferase domain-containing protein [Deltaproteobacteria bacterium]